MTEGRKK